MDARVCGCESRRYIEGGPKLNRDATMQLATSLFPKDKLEPIGEGDLSYTCPPNDELHIGCFPDGSILAAKEFVALFYNDAGRWRPCAALPRNSPAKIIEVFQPGIPSLLEKNVH